MARRKLPYGYEFREGKTVICEAEAENIRWIFNERLSGRSNYSIGQEFYNSGNPYFADNLSKANCKVVMILYKEYYADGTYPPIIDPDSFRKVQEMRGSSPNWGGNRKVAGALTERTMSNVKKKTEVTVPDPACFVFEETAEIGRFKDRIRETVNENTCRRNLRELVTELVSLRYDSIVI